VAERPRDRRRAADAKGVRVRLSCRKLWKDTEVRATSVRQGKRYAEQWCAARVLERVPLKGPVARLVADDEPARRLSHTEIRQHRRLDAIPNPKP